MSTRTLLLAVAAATLAGRAALAQPPAAMPTRDFVQAAQGSDQYEIEAAQVALIQSRDPHVRAFAQQMIQDHTVTSARLRQAALASGQTPPPMGLNEDGQRMLSQLQSLRGAEFDAAYGRQQVMAHQAALVVEQGYASSGQDAGVRRVAQSAVPVIQRHLQMAQQLRP